MVQISIFPDSHLEALSKSLGECGSASDITRILNDLEIKDNSQESTKWKRLYWVFTDLQKQHNCANHIFGFIQSFMNPVRFVGRKEEFEENREKLNTILIFSGFEYGEDGNFRKCKNARTLTEAEKRLRTIQSKFEGRKIHPEVVKYCKAELLQDNYFHAVFEATKGLAQRIRDMSGIERDGAALVDKVFAVEKPILAINSLRTETEKSEHKGFAMLLKGCFGAIRNPLAHEPKILWEGEDDAADYLSLISLLHRKLDNCVPTNFNKN
jgi:uncharacterized protein (TIGR02391 family)